MSEIPQSSVSIVLCTYQGAEFVDEQMCSLLAQSYPVRIHVFDDNSSDKTAAIVRRRCRDAIDTLTIATGNQGYVRNFEQGMQSVLTQGARYIAFADQDDIWDTDKIEHGMQMMHELEAAHGCQRPLLVHSDLRLIDASGAGLQSSFLKHRNYTISSRRNLAVVLGQNGVMGNTVLMNRALAELALPFPQELHVHDYWVAVLAELFGERALIPEAKISYRIHAGNASNKQASLGITPLQILRRLSPGKLLRRDFKLPFKEDARLAAMQLLREDTERFPPRNELQNHVLDVFIEYLAFNRSRVHLLKEMFRHGFIRRSLRHQLRFATALLTTRRYDHGRSSHGAVATGNSIDDRGLSRRSDRQNDRPAELDSPSDQ